MDEFGFLRPWFLFLLLPVCLGFILVIRKKINPEFQWPVIGILPANYRVRRPFLRIVGIIALFLVAVTFVFLAAGFFHGEKINREKIKTYVIVLIQDRSGSMYGLLGALSKVSAAFMELRPQDKFCGVYFSDTAVRTACGESAKVITSITNEDIDKSLSSRTTSIGGGTEPGAGLLKALEAIIDEAGIFSRSERDTILSSLEAKKAPFIPEDKINSHSGFLAVLESDALFPQTPSIDPAEVLAVMARLGVRVYFIVFTNERAESVISAVKGTGGETYFINPAISSQKTALEKELNMVFVDIDTLNPRETFIVSGVTPRKFLFELGLILVILAWLYIFLGIIEELTGLVRAKIEIRRGKEAERK